MFVPHIAASGGTLLALTGDAIRMGSMSQLGPLDPQRLYLDHGFVSVNSMLRAKNKLDKIFSKKHENEVGYPDRHMAEMLDPVMYEEFYGSYSAAMIYIHTILGQAKYEESKIDEIVEELVFDFPTHDFVIDRNTAEEIGIKVVPDDVDSSAWNVMRNWLAKYVVRETDKHFIRYCIPDKKDA